MFRWNIAKSAEEMFSRWAIKRVCQFLLKKKLGQFILGDIDLNQLDVQLSAGTIQLSDLALNVDYLNQKFGAEAAVIVKEGSIGSLLVTMPWKGKGCEIEVEELELVLAPCAGLNHQFGSGTHIPKKDGNYSTIHEPGRLEHEKVENAMMSASLDVHEGVKTIAKMVKWLLTSFHVKVRKLIVAFDSSLVDNEKNIGFYKTLVLRISEIECGTCISEEVASSTDSAAGNFLGLNQLTSFVKFQGATLEFLQVDGVGYETHLPCASGITFGEWFPACCPSNVRTPVVTGQRGGFSGTLKLSIPWKNGSLDICKVDADAHIDPLELRFQPSSMKWFLFLLEIIRESGKNSKDHVDYKTTESVYFNASSDCHSSTLGSSVISNDAVMLCNENIPSDFCSPLGRDATALLPESQLISDWVPFSFSKNQKGGTEEKPDFGASMEQFFECFDGMRSSQSALGSSGMWNWTCSVFSAITAASNLASGSLHIDSEQQHVETNLKVTVSGISVLFSLLDGDQQHSCEGDQTNGGSYAHYLGAKFQDIVLVLQVCPQEMNLKAMVQHIELSDHFSNGDDAMQFGFRGCNDIEGQMLMIQQIQAAVQGVLPPFSSSAKDAGSEEPHGSVPVDFPFTMSRLDRCISRTNCKGIYRDDVVKTTFLRTSGGTHCQFTVNSSSSDDNFPGPRSFSLKLPPVLFWVNSHLINDLLGLLREVGNSFEMDSTKDGSVSECFNGVSCSSSQGEVKRRSCSSLKTSSPQECLRGNIFLTTARVIFCFPFENNGDLRSYAYWNEFIALDFSSPLNLTEENVQVTAPFSNASSQKSYSSTISRSFHLNVGNLDIYLITSASHCSVQSNDDGKQRPKYFAENIFSSTNRRGHLSVISILWQKGAVTGPWMGKRAKLIATPENSRGRNKFVGKDYEFASVTASKDMEDFNNHARKDMILSSEFFIHACLSSVKINLASSQYKALHRLLQQAIDGLSSEVSDPVSVKNDSTVSQTSILVECDSAEISVCQEMIESIKSSIQNELPGSWHRFKLQIENFQLLSVSNIGGIGGSNFFWLTHGEGNLWGSITEVPNKEFLLISCSNSTVGRGDGEGSNVLSYEFSGSEIIHMWDPETSHSSMSITVRCGTIVGIGGRLDWLEAISSFFSLASPEDDNSMKKGNSVDSIPCESSFVLTLVDVGLSYEPYLKELMVSEVFDSGFSSVNNEGIHGQHVGCLLAASLLKLSNSKVAGCIDSDYKIRLQDLGLLICAVPGTETVSGRYSVGHLHQVGYVKVAREANVEAILRMNCENDLLWELECSGSHIFLDTCHDTTSGLIRLAAQLQQLFAPDVEESVVHLQTRWNNVQKAKETDETRFCNGNSAPSTSQVDMERKPGVVNLMDEICEDAFHLDGHWDGKSDSSELQLQISVDDVLEETCDLSARDPESSPHNLPLPGSVALNVLGSNQPSFLQKGFPELIESYFLTESCPMSELSQQKQSSNDIHKQKSRNMEKGDVEKLSNGWYEGGSLNILEDHVTDLSTRTGPQLVAEETTPSNCSKTNDHGKARGRVLLKNIDVIWRMYSGSDWHNFRKDVLHSPIIGGRDRTVCLELALSRMDFQYEIFPDGEICVSRLSLSVQDFYLNDNSQDAPWKLVLGYYQSKDHPRKSFSKLFKLDLEAVRPDPLTPLEEYRLRIAFLPMLLHLHQSQLDFIISFFGGKSSNAPWDMSEPEVLSKNTNYGGPAICEEALLPYFQKLDMWPVLVRVDYNPCHVDLAALLGGKYVELVNLVPWKGVEIQLKHVQAVGVYGWSSVCETIIGKWLEDISQRQIHKLLRGLPPIRALASLSSGAAQLVSLPVENYRKDHRLLKGLQRGTIAFLRSISVEAVGLGVHLAAGTHELLLQAECIFSRIPQSVPWPVQSRMKTTVRSNQPKNARQGIQQAYESIGDGLGRTASALVRTPLKRYQCGAGVGSALATAVQAAPAAAIAPASAAACAVRCALLGVRNSLDPEHKKESFEKYLGATQYREDMTGVQRVKPLKQILPLLEEKVTVLWKM